MWEMPWLYCFSCTWSSFLWSFRRLWLSGYPLPSPHLSLHPGQNPLWPPKYSCASVPHIPPADVPSDKCRAPLFQNQAWFPYCIPQAAEDGSHSPVFLPPAQDQRVSSDRTYSFSSPRQGCPWLWKKQWSSAVCFRQGRLTPPLWSGFPPHVCWLPGRKHAPESFAESYMFHSLCAPVRSDPRPVFRYSWSHTVHSGCYLQLR